MKTESMQVIKIILTDLDRLDPVTVIAEDIEQGIGEITITCYGKAWTAYWGGMGAMYSGDMSDWHYSLPTMVNPEYEYLCLIIKAIQAGFVELSVH